MLQAREPFITMVSALPSGLSEASYSSLLLQASLILKAEIATVAAGKLSLRAFGSGYS